MRFRSELMEFFLNVFTEFIAFSDKQIVNTVKGFEPATQPSLWLETMMLPDTC